MLAVVEDFIGPKVVMYGSPAEGLQNANRTQSYLTTLGMAVKTGQQLGAGKVRPLGFTSYPHATLVKVCYRSLL